MEDFLVYVRGLNTATWFVMLALVSMGSYIMHQIIDSRLMTLGYAGVFQLGALVINFIALKNDLALANDSDSNLIILSTIGMICGLCVMIMAVRSFQAVNDASRPKVSR